MNLLMNDNVILRRENQKNIVTTHTLVTSVTTCVTCDCCDAFFLKNISFAGKSTTHNRLSFLYSYFLFKIMLFNFFRILKSCSSGLVLLSYVMKYRNPVLTSLCARAREGCQICCFPSQKYVV